MNKDSFEYRYLKTIAELYPSIAEASTEIINLQSILNLPKGTEHFLTDIHGEYESFLHVLKNGSGSIRRKIEEEFGNSISSKDKKSLATLIYYPASKLELVLKEEDNIEDWYKITIHRLIRICRRAASKYTRSKVRKALPKDFAYIIEELITEKEELLDKEAYYNEIINTIIRIDRARELIMALGELIQRLVIDHLHIVGDIFDRGPGPHIIMDTLMNYHSVDIQWGNHDIVWMGAASGHLACIANVVRISSKYGNLNMLEDGYGINLIPLATFALKYYSEDPCECFKVDRSSEEGSSTSDIMLERRMHKAISIIQFKLEGQIIQNRKDFHMESRLLLDKMNLEKGVVMIGDTEYPLLDTHFPTISMEDPYSLTDDEIEVMKRLKKAFLKCEKLQRHVRFLYSQGSLYKVYNSNLLYHGCVPLNEDGSFRKVNVFGHGYSGKALYDILERYARKGYYSTHDPEEKKRGQDILWYIWSNENSPVYGKNKMATFERYFLEDKEMRNEIKDSYYSLVENEEIVNHILKEFGLDTETSHIINGHMPVRLKKGETPVKCNGKLLIIDGGFSKAYQKQTGIAGYTLIYNSYGLRLVSHEPFESIEDAIINEKDIHSDTVIVEQSTRRQLVSSTDKGEELVRKIFDLEKLLHAYRTGVFSQK
ncbi:MAG: fructose-1,6-bisphosphatase [Lachnospiraceae bacterium]|nr:fructose-1,6-bisphosphatase [Lachnospiraceae bacterium]